MKSLGYILITLGFLVGALTFRSSTPSRCQWSIVVPGLLVGSVRRGPGSAVDQGSEQGRRRGTEPTSASSKGVWQRIVEKITELDADKESVNVYDVHDRIDEVFMADLDTFVENRESIGHAFGLQTYADVMTHFATAERYLNRCWSASADGYIDEVHTYLTRAEDQFTLALELLRSHTVQGGTQPQ